MLGYILFSDIHTYIPSDWVIHMEVSVYGAFNLRRRCYVYNKTRAIKFLWIINSQQKFLREREKKEKGRGGKKRGKEMH
jgi:hypothetical protein